MNAVCWREDKFRLDDLVTWASDYYAELIHGRRHFGDGPFRVVMIENESPAHELYESRYAGMGHTQYVTVDHGEMTHRYSGAFFRLVERPSNVIHLPTARGSHA